MGGCLYPQERVAVGDKEVEDKVDPERDIAEDVEDQPSVRPSDDEREQRQRDEGVPDGDVDEPSHRRSLQRGGGEHEAAWP